MIAIITLFIKEAGAGTHAINSIELSFVLSFQLKKYENDWQ